MGMSISSLPAAAPSVNPAAQLAGLEAQIAQYKQQLSDCVNCDSATTVAGQTAIEELSSKIKVTRERLDTIAATKSGDSGEKVQGSADVPAVKPLADQAVDPSNAGSTASQSEARRLAPTGALLDVFA